MATSLPAVFSRTLKGQFWNEPLTNFSLPENIHAMNAPLERVASLLGHEYGLIVGRRLKTREKILSSNPANPEQVVGFHRKACKKPVKTVMQAALTAYESWRKTSEKERASPLLRAAEIIRNRKFESCAWLIYEVGKNWAEADAEVGETLDCLEFHAREAVRPSLATMPIPYSSDAPTVAALFVQVLEKAGIAGTPDGVVNFCPGAGNGFGTAIVKHLKIRFIALTGSREAGLEIYAQAAQLRLGQIWPKRTIREMGGKSSIPVCSDAYLDAALDGVKAAASGFSGQKRAACSRVIIEGPACEIFLERLRERAASIQEGDPVVNAPMGPLINEYAKRSILRYIEAGKAEGRLLVGGHAVNTATKGYFLEPTVFADVSSPACLAQEGIFGPVLALISSARLSEAFAITDHTEYGLPGAIYVGCVWLWIKLVRNFMWAIFISIVSAPARWWESTAFGGFNMSGTDSKAGGPDYLCLFTQAKSVAEKLHC